MSTEYPPEPWDLRGRAAASLWLVPVGDLPRLPAGVRPVSLFGRAVVATAFVHYEPGGLLSYHELLVAPLVRRGTRIGLSITDIWVDSPASLAGGRELWGIPKDLADFELAGGDATASADGALLASASFRRSRTGARTPFPLRGTAIQSRYGSTAVTPLRSTGRIHPATASWRLGDRLAWLRSRRPLLSLTVHDFDLRFGPRRR
jgi:acetoacetate decarboxylase